MGEKKIMKTPRRKKTKDRQRKREYIVASRCSRHFCPHGLLHLFKKKKNYHLQSCLYKGQYNIETFFLPRGSLFSLIKKKVKHSYGSERIVGPSHYLYYALIGPERRQQSSKEQSTRLIQEPIPSGRFLFILVFPAPHWNKSAYSPNTQ